jgi:tRNA (adenine57-N1/adenine58-N1)-methyltransferase
MIETDVAILHPSGAMVYKKGWRGEPISTTWGIVSAEAIRHRGKTKTSKGEEVLVLEPMLRDRVQNMTKGARPVYEYDAGFAAGLLSLERGMHVLEAGTGSGAVTLVLAQVADSIDTFEKEERFFEIAKENFEKAGAKNIRPHLGSVLDAKLAGEYDAVFLDLAEPWKAMRATAPCLKQGRFMCIYTPVIDDVKPVLETFKELGFVQARGIFMDTKEVEVKKYARVKGQFGFPGFFIVARRF